MFLRTIALAAFYFVYIAISSFSALGFEPVEKQSGSYFLSCDSRNNGAYFSCTVSVGLGSNGRVAIFLTWVLNSDDNISFQLCDGLSTIDWSMPPIISSIGKSVTVIPLDKPEICTVTDPQIYLNILSIFWNNEYVDFSYRTFDVGVQIAHGIRTAGFRELLEESFARTGNAKDLQHLLQIMPK